MRIHTPLGRRRDQDRSRLFFGSGKLVAGTVGKKGLELRGVALHS